VSALNHRRGSAGNTLVGILLGLLVGLAIAVVAAVYMTRSSVPFVNKAPRGSDKASEAGRNGADLPDPNRPLSSRARSGAPGAEAPAGGLASSTPGPSPSPAPPTAPGAPPGAAGPPGSAGPPGATGRGTAPGPVASAPPSAAGSAGEPSDKAAYLLQAGAFKGQEDADNMKAKLALIGFEARIVTAEVNGTTFYRVRVGPYAQLEDMNKVRSRLAENGIEASVVRQR
jgi:cell division protein FtsN